MDDSNELDVRLKELKADIRTILGETTDTLIEEPFNVAALARVNNYLDKAKRHSNGLPPLGKMVYEIDQTWAALCDWEFPDPDDRHYVRMQRDNTNWLVGALFSVIAVVDFYLDRGDDDDLALDLAIRTGRTN